MPSANRDLLFRFLSDTKDYQDGVKRIDKNTAEIAGRMEKFGKRMKGALGVVGVAGAIALGKELFAAGAEAEAMERRFATVFAGVTDTLDEWVEDQSAAFGLSKAGLEGMLAGVGDLLVPMGVSRDVAAEMSTEIVTLANALSEWTGGSISAADAADVVTKAMLGERDGLVALGVKISEADLKNQLLADGTADLTGIELQRVRALTTLELIQGKSTDALSAYDERAGSAVASSKELSAGFADMKESAADLVMLLVPLVTSVADLERGINDLVTGDHELFSTADVLAVEGWKLAVEGSETPLKDLGAELITATAELGRNSDKARAIKQAYVDLGGDVNDLGAAYGHTSGEVESFDEALEASKAAIAAAERQERLKLAIETTGDALALFDTTPPQEALDRYEESLADAVRKSQEAIDELGRLFTDDFVAVFEESEGDIDAAISSALDVAEQQRKFRNDLIRLGAVGLQGLASQLERSPNRRAAMAAAADVGSDVVTAYRVGTAGGFGGSALLQALIDELGTDAARLTALAAWYGNLGAEHRAAYDASFAGSGSTAPGTSGGGGSGGGGYNPQQGTWVAQGNAVAARNGLGV